MSKWTTREFQQHIDDAVARGDKQLIVPEGVLITGEDQPEGGIRIPPHFLIWGENPHTCNASCWPL